MKRIVPLAVLVLLIMPTSQFAFAAKGGAARYKSTKPYVTKTGQFRSGAVKDVSANGNEFDNAKTLGMNPKR